MSKFITTNLDNMRYMFKDCSKLKTVNLSMLTTGKVTNMGSLFENCFNLENIIFPNDTSNVIYMPKMLYGCKSLTSLDLSHFNTSSLTTTDEMFGDCVNIKYLDISSFNINQKSKLFNNKFSKTGKIIVNNYSLDYVDKIDILKNWTKELK